MRAFNKLKQKKIALERIRILFNEADNVFKEDKKLADNYVNKARKIAMKVNLRFPKELKRKFCKHCYSYLKPGVNCRIRTRNKMVLYYCDECKKYMRFGLSKKIKK